MRRTNIIAVLLGLVVFHAVGLKTVTAAAKRTLEGQIVEFQCGDNCYLTIKTTGGKEESGLCAARECKNWVEKAEMPISFVGKRVRVTLGTGAQLDANGNVARHMASFDSIQFLR